jgi:hypothetical protein
MMISLILFILYEIANTAVLCYLAISLSKSTNTQGIETPIAIERFQRGCRSARKAMIVAWFGVFPITVICGISAAAILLCGWVRWLWTIK